MLEHKILREVAEQMLRRAEVTVEGRTARVTRTGSGRLRTVRFPMER